MRTHVLPETSADLSISSTADYSQPGGPQPSAESEYEAPVPRRIQPQMSILLLSAACLRLF